MKYPDECYFNHCLFDQDLVFQSARRLIRDDEINPLPSYTDALLDAITTHADAIAKASAVRQVNGDELRWAPIMLVAASENTTRSDRLADILRLPNDEPIRTIEPRLRAADLWIGDTVIYQHWYGASGDRLFLQDLLVADGRLLRFRLPGGRYTYAESMAVC